jgi:hypothetical protein
MPAMPNDLSQLHDIQLPAPIGFWPIAWGWWALLILIISAIVVSAIWWRRNRYRFFAKKQLTTYFHDYQQNNNHHLYCQQAASLLRQLAITHYGRQMVSNLNGTEWIIFLNAKVKSPVFDELIATYLTQAPFCDVDYFNSHFGNADINKLHKQLLAWVRNHQ